MSITRWRTLTTQERKIVVLIAEGLSNNEIAERVFLSPHTVKSHVMNILAKLGVRSRIQVAVAYITAAASPEAPVTVCADCGARTW